MAGLQRVDVDRAGQHLGDGLREAAGERRRAGGTRLARRKQQDRNAARHARLQATTGIEGEAERRHDEAAGHRDEGPGGERPLAAGDHVQHVDRGVHRLGRREGGADMLARPSDGGIAGVEVHLEGILEIAGHDGTLEEVDVVARVDEARDVVEVQKGRVAILAALQVQQMHGGAGGAEMHAPAAQVHVVAGIAAVQHQFAGNSGQHVLDQRPGEQQPARLRQPATDGGDRLHAARDRLGEADILQNIEHRVMHFLKVALA